MMPQPSPLPSRHGPTAFLVVMVSSLIALAVTLIQDTPIPWYSELLISNAIGFCIWGMIEAILKLSGGRIGVIPSLFVAVPAGIFIGGKAAALLGMPDFVAAFAADPLHEWRSIVVSLLFAASATAFVVKSARAADIRLELEIERRRRAEASRSQAVAELGLLQAQIEPHFLFNTLAHVQSAIEQDPALGKKMLEHLIRYLRGTLRRSRSAYYTLAEELELIDSLLVIASIRLGHRLRSRVSCAEALRHAVLPPLLLQPLVENAIKHGIEPAIDGGDITIEAQGSDDTLVLRVTDTGIGMSAAGPEGVGLSNVRARLASLYGDQGRLTLQSRPAGGVVAELRLPLKRK
jgi:LytS/YehU family sensor histidine kinase